MRENPPEAARPVVLVFPGTYLPGFRAGGPVRSVANMVEALSEHFQFNIITQDNDFGSALPYDDITPDVWTEVGKAQVMYLSRKGRAPYRIWKLISNMSYDVLYLNSYFEPRFSIFPFLLWRLHLIKRTPVILAPRGSFSGGALGLKRIKKWAYIKFSNMLNIYNNELVYWQASSEYEKKDIENAFFHAVKISIAPPVTDRMPTAKAGAESLPASVARGNATIFNRPRNAVVKKPGSVSLIFIGRINRMKNLDFAIRTLVGLHGEVVLDIFGPDEDITYWQECKYLIDGLGKNVTINFHYQIPHERILVELSTHHFLLLPTLGENFGHVIFESLVAGCPVIISDRTPWRGLIDKGVGWDLPLNDISVFRDVLKKCVDMDEMEYNNLSIQAMQFENSNGISDLAIKGTLELLKKPLETHPVN